MASADCGETSSALSVFLRCEARCSAWSRMSRSARGLAGRSGCARKVQERARADRSIRFIAAALIVFGVGLVFGQARVFWLEPRLGETVAVLCEAPLLLFVIAQATRWLPRTVGLKPTVASMSGMGVGALFSPAIGRLRCRHASLGCTPQQIDLRLAVRSGSGVRTRALARVALSGCKTHNEKHHSD